MGIERHFVQLSRAWYAPASLPVSRQEGILDEISIGYADEPRYCNGVYAEFCIEFHEVGAELRVFDQAMPYLMEHSKDLLEFLAKNPKGLTPRVLCEALTRMGYTDATEEVLR